MSEKKHLMNWIEREVVPRVLQNEYFVGACVQQTEIREIPTNTNNFCSEMFGIDLLLAQKGKEKKMSLLLKMMNLNEKARILYKTSQKFINEIHFYSNVFPFLSSQILSSNLNSKFQQTFPKCYESYCIDNKLPVNITDAVLIMENLNENIFKLGNRTSLDLKHCSLALKRLGMFHAVSYFAKEQDFNGFINNIVKPIKETRFIDTQLINSVYGAHQRRVVDVLSTRLSEDHPVFVRLKDLALKRAFDVFIDMLQPREPLAVLCHGDFLRNNVLFRYENGDPVDMKFLDFQTIRYASPAIDISVFICMHTTHEFRVSHFDELLRIYHSSLMDAMVTLFKKPKEQLEARYSFESFFEDIGYHFKYGYLTAIQFIPWMLVNDKELKEIVELTSEEMGSPRYNEAAQHWGGKEAADMLVNLALDLIDKRFL